MIGPLVTVESNSQRSRGNILYQKNGRQWQKCILDKIQWKCTPVSSGKWIPRVFKNSTVAMMDAFELQKKIADVSMPWTKETWHTAETKKTMLRLMSLFHCILSALACKLWTNGIVQNVMSRISRQQNDNTGEKGDKCFLHHQNCKAYSQKKHCLLASEVCQIPTREKKIPSNSPRSESTYSFWLLKEMWSSL